MKIETLKKSGLLLYGQQWKSDLARDLGIDPRRVRHWVKGARKIPPGVSDDIIEILRERKFHIEEAICELRQEA